jgi:hypothetical protein
VPVIEEPEAYQPRQGQPLTVEQSNTSRAIGTPVSQSMTGPNKGAMRPIYNAVVDAIDSVHGDGELMPVPVKFSKMTSKNGHYKFYPSNNKPVEIKVSTIGTHKHMTLTHETGHYLDEQVLKISKSMADKRIRGIGLPEEYAEWVNAIDNTSTVQRLKEMYSGAREFADGIPADRKYVRYLLQYDELWARSYAQYIATKSQNANMLGELAQTLDFQGKAMTYPVQWSADEFAPVVEAIDKIMRAKGWME